MTGQTLHQIEISSRCQLGCVYCLQPRLTRPVQDLSRADFEAALRWVKYFRERGTQGEIVLCGTGESTLHPEMVEYVRLARLALGPTRRLLLTTNGLLVDDAFVRAVQPYHLRVYVSLHRPELAAEAVHRLGDAGLLEGVSIDPVVNANSWAGQVPWRDVLPLDGSREPCPWRQAGWLFVGSNGVIYPCCYANGDMPALASIQDAPHAVTMQATTHCSACWLRAPLPSEEGQAPRLRR
jgi:hypothetical protein